MASHPKLLAPKKECKAMEEVKEELASFESTIWAANKFYTTSLAS